MPTSEPSSEPSTEGPDSALQAERSSAFYFADLYIQVENTLYKVNRRDFEQGSEVFGTMFELPSGDLTPEGGSDEHPLVLEGIKASDMDQFLSAMYPPASKEAPLTGEQWCIVLKLAKMWGFAALVAESLKVLKSNTRDDPVARYKLSREFDLDEDEWLVPAITRLVRQEEFTLAQAEQLDMLTTMQVCVIRGECGMYSALNARVPIDSEWLTDRIRGMWNVPPPPELPPAPPLSRVRTPNMVLANFLPNTAAAALAT